MGRKKDPKSQIEQASHLILGKPELTFLIDGLVEDLSTLLGIRKIREANGRLI
jgi:hypothetical protein